MILLLVFFSVYLCLIYFFVLLGVVCVLSWMSLSSLLHFVASSTCSAESSSSFSVLFEPLELCVPCAHFLLRLPLFFSLCELCHPFPLLVWHFTFSDTNTLLLFLLFIVHISLFYIFFVPFLGHFLFSPCFVCPSVSLFFVVFSFSIHLCSLGSSLVLPFYSLLSISLVYVSPSWFHAILSPCIFCACVCVCVFCVFCKGASLTASSRCRVSAIKISIAELFLMPGHPVRWTKTNRRSKGLDFRSWIEDSESQWDQKARSQDGIKKPVLKTCDPKDGSAPSTHKDPGPNLSAKTEGPRETDISRLN